MQDVLIIMFKLQEFDWLSGYWSNKSCPWSTWTDIHIYFNQTLIHSGDIEDWLILKCNWPRAFLHVCSKLIGYAYTFHWCLPAPRKSNSDINAFKRYWRLKNTQDELAESISGHVHQTYSKLTSSTCFSRSCLPQN